GKDKTDVKPPSQDDIAYVMYTSGTTGNPKGGMLFQLSFHQIFIYLFVLEFAKKKKLDKHLLNKTIFYFVCICLLIEPHSMLLTVMLPHRAFAAMCATAFRKVQCNRNDIHLSYLPMAHSFFFFFFKKNHDFCKMIKCLFLTVFESFAQQVFLSAGAKIAFFQGDIRGLGNDWKDIRPTILIGLQLQSFFYIDYNTYIQYIYTYIYMCMYFIYMTLAQFQIRKKKKKKLMG
ncbi:long-chain-fatty-acid--CoA ligase 6, partial [Reticulomyxa filosa]